METHELMKRSVNETYVKPFFYKSTKLIVSRLFGDTCDL